MSVHIAKTLSEDCHCCNSPRILHQYPLLVEILHKPFRGDLAVMIVRSEMSRSPRNSDKRRSVMTHAGSGRPESQLGRLFEISASVYEIIILVLVNRASPDPA